MWCWLACGWCFVCACATIVVTCCSSLVPCCSYVADWQAVGTSGLPAAVEPEIGVDISSRDVDTAGSFGDTAASLEFGSM